MDVSIRKVKRLSLMASRTSGRCFIYT